MSDLTRPHVKIASCSSCGARTLLELSARDGHELACAACGAALHEMKPRKRRRDPEPLRKAPRDKTSRQQRKPDRERERKKARVKPTSRKKKTSLKRQLKRLLDRIEDIFD